MRLFLPRNHRSNPTFRNRRGYSLLDKPRPSQNIFVPSIQHTEKGFLFRFSGQSEIGKFDPHSFEQWKANHRRFLNQWMRKEGCFPSGSVPKGSLPYTMANWVDNHEGKKVVFDRVLDEDVKQIPLVRWQADHKAYLNEWMRKEGCFPSGSAPRGSLLYTMVKWIGHQDGKKEVFDWILDEDVKQIPLVRWQADHKAYLNEWMRKEGRFPLGTAPRGSLPYTMAKWIGYQGGQKAVFDEILDEDVKQLPLVCWQADYKAYLNEWMRKEGCFPSGTAPKDSLQYIMAKSIANQGGRKVVFDKVLDEDVKELPRVKAAIQ